LCVGIADGFWVFFIRSFSQVVSVSANDKLRDEEGLLGLVAAAKKEQTGEHPSRITPFRRDDTVSRPTTGDDSG
jgi:hypothetical protein